MICQNCFAELEYSLSWDEFEQYPVFCSKCDLVRFVINDKSNKDKIPAIDLYKWVYCTNKQHKFYLDPALIVSKSHLHYRLLFHDKVKIWMPEHWVKPLEW